MTTAATTAATAATTITGAAAAVPKRAQNAIQRAGHTIRDLTADQRARAVTCEQVKAGLTGKALANWIMRGDCYPPEERLATQVAVAEHRRAAADRRAAANPNRSTMTTATATATATKPRRPGVLAHAEQVLADTGRPMHMRAIADAVIARNDALPVAERTLKGKTPAATISAQVSVCARDGGAIEKIAPGVFALRAWDDVAKTADPVIPDGVRLRNARNPAN
jgi:hypothetical protein